MTSREKIRASALEILASTPKGVRYSDLMRRVQEDLPSMPFNTITGSLWNFDVIKPAEVYKPGRGIFRHTKFRETEAEEDISKTPITIETPTRRVAAKQEPDMFYVNRNIKIIEDELFE